MSKPKATQNCREQIGKAPEFVILSGCTQDHSGLLLTYRNAVYVQTC